MSKSSGHEIFISAAFFKTLATVFLDTPQLCAMFRSLNPKLCKRRISRYLVIIVTSFTCIHTNGVYQQYKGNICNRAFKCGSELPEYVALILRNGGSQSPDRWLRELRNNQLFKVWRNLRPDEVVSDGLSAKLPGRNMSIAGHLMNGSRHNGAQFISTTTDPKVIEKWNEPGQRIVMFDTDDVIPDVLGNKNIIDISTPEKARAAGLKRGRPYSNAVSSKEVLVEGRVPANKLTITCPG